MVENVPPVRVWEALQNESKAQLVDVRTDAEWNFVGLADLSSVGKHVVGDPVAGLSDHGAQCRLHRAAD